MRCKRCGELFGQDEADRVAENFDAGDDHCFPCSEELWREREQDQQMSDVVQDGPDDYERLKAKHEVLYKELEMASDLLADVYAQVGNHRPPTIRHALTPGLRDGIRDFLHARKTIVVKKTRDDLRTFTKREGAS